MKRISSSAAQRCEDAATKRCRCRCKGVLHGARRGEVEALHLNDPHNPRTVEQMKLPLRLVETPADIEPEVAYL